MMHGIILKDAYALPFVEAQQLAAMEAEVTAAHDKLHGKQGAGSDYLGWLEWPLRFDRQEYDRLKQAAAAIRRHSDILLVVGIGGSYLGAKAGIDMLTHRFYNELPAGKRGGPQIYFTGNQLSSACMADLLELLDDREISVNVISKSGTTTEPAVAFRILREYMEKRYGRAAAAKRIFATTDRSQGALKAIADAEGYECFVIPDDIGGRYSVLTPVGLLPMAVAGIDIDEVMAGAADGNSLYGVKKLADNPCYQYAALRNLLYRQGKTVEFFAAYEPALQYFAEWWKQLYGESEGKDRKGILPASVGFTTDLHSMGQYIQDGLRQIFETVLYVGDTGKTVIVEVDPVNADGLNFLAGQDLASINRRAMQGTMLAHMDGGVPGILLEVPALTPFYFGQLVYFFEKACGISGHVLGVNPFDQPGVEAYKRNMFALLGKPGFEQQREVLEKRLK